MKIVLGQLEMLKTGSGLALGANKNKEFGEIFITKPRNPRDAHVV